MGIVYYKEFSPLTASPLNIIKQSSGKISEAILHIEFSGVKVDLKLKNPKLPSIPSMDVKELFHDITPESVSSFEVFGNQHKPDTILWYIEIRKNYSKQTVHCSEIEGLPEGGWKNKAFPDL